MLLSTLHIISITSTTFVIYLFTPPSEYISVVLVRFGIERCEFSFVQRRVVLDFFCFTELSMNGVII